jgi:hypoxanthine-DNA glycosylase
MTEIAHEIKTSFAPVAGPATRILILGTLPGEISLGRQQYYAHPRNRFWPLMAALTKNELPEAYPDRLELLLRNGFGLWDVVDRAKRAGSLDSNIVEETPNDLPGFVAAHPGLQAIAFNGAKSRILFDKYFPRLPELKYFALPSTSPANASFDLARLYEHWSILMNIDHSVSSAII